MIVERLEQRRLLAIDLDFAIPLGASGQDLGQAVTTDSSGNVIAVGRFVGTIDFDPGPGTYNLAATGGEAVYFAKYSPAGALLWAGVTRGGSADGLSVGTDAAGNVFVAGAFAGPTDFDPGMGTATLTHTGVGDGFILKLDPAGNFAWVKQITGGRHKIFHALATDAAGNVYAGGKYDGIIDLDPGPGTTFVSGGSESFSQAFVVKLDSAGDFQWGGAFTGADGSYASIVDLAVDSGGSVLTSGFIHNQIDFDPGPGEQLVASDGSLADAFVAKLDANGNLTWVRRLGGTGYDFGLALGLDAAGNAYAGGVFSGTIDFDPGAPSYPLTSAGDYDGYIVKFSAAGDLAWAKRVGGTQQEYVAGIVLDGSGSLYATGYFNGTADFDPGAGVFNLTSAGARDVFLLKLDSSGAFVFAASVGGPGDEAPSYSRSIALDPAGDIVITGHFSGVADFDPNAGVHNLASAGDFDAFVAKFCGSTVVTSAVDDFSNTENTETSQWSYRWSSDTVRDGAYSLLPANDFAVQFTPPITTWNIGNGAFVGVNRSGGPVQTVTFAPGFTLPDDTIIMSPNGLAVISWLSPVSGQIDIQYSFADLEQAFSGNDLARYYVDRNDSAGQLAAGTLPELGTTGVASLQNVKVAAGDRINFVIDSNGINAADSIAFRATITYCNRPPVADAGGPYFVPEGGSVLLAGSGSDPDGGSLNYAWDLDNNGTFETPGQNVLFSAAGRDGPDSQTVVLRVTDTNGASTTSSVTIGIANVAPTIAISGASNVDEGAPYSLTLGTGTDPGVDTATSYIVHWGDGYSDSYGSAGVKSHTYADGPNSYHITVDLVDEDGAFLGRANALGVSVDNVRPSATANTYVTAQAAPISGNVIADDTGAGADSDLAGTYDPLTVSSHTSPANGTLVIGAGGGFTYTPASTFAGTDSFTYTISDGDGGVATATVTIVVTPAAPGSITTIADTCLGGTALLVTGTAAGDTIIVEPGATSATLVVTLNGTTSTVARPSGRIIVTGALGDDNIQIAGAVLNQAWLYGEGGNDRLTAGNGGGLLLGGDGNDQLLGGSGRDIMVGGQGADRLVGNANDDILIAALTSYDDRSTAGHEEFWCQVLAEWRAASLQFSDRVMNLRTGGGTTGVNLLEAVVDDCFDDDIDFLNGSSGEDWLIFLAGKDRVAGQTEAAN